MRVGTEMRARAVVHIQHLLFACCLVAVAPTAGAFTVYYDGPGGFGVGESNALAASAAGVPIRQATSLEPIDGLLASIDKDLDLGSVVNPSAPSRSNPVQGTSQWQLGFTAQAASMTIATESVWLILTRSTDFADGTVGLELDPALGWVLVEAQAGEQTFYYPGVDVGPPPLDGPTTETVMYRVATDLPNVDGILTFPQFQAGLAILVPEPGSWLLLGMGLVGLAVAGRRSCS